MVYLKYKDDLPQKTIINITKIFMEKLGIEFSVKIHERTKGVYSANIIDSIGGWSTCGKGTNSDYCLASGFGEAIEHFCNYNAFDYSLIKEDNKSIMNFERYFDENKRDINSVKYDNPDLFDDMRMSFADSIKIDFNDQDVIDAWEEYFHNTKTTFVPYFDIRNNCIKYLPEQIIDVLCGSNGGGAGNTNEEAIGHALDEVIERFVKYKIYHERITPPNIDLNYIKSKSNDLFNLIKNIESSYNCEILIKDASLGKGFTALCVLMLDKNNHSYLVNFGAHPKFEIALERCITEMFQAYEKGNTIKRKNLQVWNPFLSNENHSINNWASLLRDDVGIIPNEFFYDKPTWEFKPWEEFKEYNNKIGAQYQINKLLESGYNIYIRNNSFLGFPVFKVYVPGVSLNHIPFNKKQLKLLDITKNIQSLMIENLSLSDEVIENAKSIFLDDTIFGQLLLRKSSSQDLLLLQASIMFDNNNVLKAIEILKCIDDDESKRIIIYLKLLDTMSVEDAIRLMLHFYAKKELESLTKWNQGNTFKSLFVELISRENYSINLEKQKYLNDLYLKFKNIQFNNMISQSRKLF